MGFAGAFGESALGLLLLGGQQQRLVGAVAATLMHVFIFFFGIGPYRWNVMQVYLCWAVWWHNRGLDDTFAFKSLESLDVAQVAYVLVLGVLVPVLGIVSPRLLGHVGGYRMATFHFAGNEWASALFVKRTLLQALRNKHTSSSKDKNSSTTTTLDDCLLRRVSECSKQFNADDEFLKFPVAADGFDIDAATRHPSFVAATGAKSYHESIHTFVFVTLDYLNINGPLLLTKWDESIHPIRRRFLELVRDSLHPRRKGDVLLLEAMPMPFFSRGKPWRLSDVATGEVVHEGVVRTPWRSQIDCMKQK